MPVKEARAAVFPNPQESQESVFAFIVPFSSFLLLAATPTYITHLSNGHSLHQQAIHLITRVMLETYNHPNA